MPYAFTKRRLQRENALVPTDAYFRKWTDRSQSYMQGWRQHHILTNDIHPIWAFENFNFSPSNTSTQLTSEKYEFLRPALRLASRYLTSDPCLAWWCTLVKGKIKRRQCHEGHAFRPVLEEVEPDHATIKQVRELFEAMAVRTKFRFEKTKGYTDAYASTAPRSMRGGKSFIHVFETVLNPSYLKFQDRKSDVWANYRYWYMLATTLVHELSHNVWSIKNGKWWEHNGWMGGIDLASKVTSVKRWEDEAYFSVKEEKQEIGWSWEYWMWGGSVTNVRGPGDLEENGFGRDGLCWQRIRSLLGNKLKDHRQEDRYAGVVMDSILDYFLDEVWDKVAKEGMGPLQMKLTWAASQTAKVLKPYQIEDEKKRLEDSRLCDYDLRFSGPTHHGRVVLGEGPPHKRARNESVDPSHPALAEHPEWLEEIRGSSVSPPPTQSPTPHSKTSTSEPDMLVVVLEVPKDKLLSISTTPPSSWRLFGPPDYLLENQLKDTDFLQKRFPGLAASSPFDASSPFRTRK